MLYIYISSSWYPLKYVTLGGLHGSPHWWTSDTSAATTLLVGL